MRHTIGDYFLVVTAVTAAVTATVQNLICINTYVYTYIVYVYVNSLFPII